MCGGISAALAGHGEPDRIFIDKWIGLLDRARDKVIAQAPENPQHALELEGVKVSLANLRTFPFVAEREAAGTLQLHGGRVQLSVQAGSDSTATRLRQQGGALADALLAAGLPLDLMTVRHEPG